MKIPQWVLWIFLILCSLWMGCNLIYIKNPIHSITAFLNLMTSGILLLDSMLNVPISGERPT